MNKQYDQVKQFHAAVGVEMPIKPTILQGAGDNNNMFWSVTLDDDSKIMKRNNHKGGEVKRRASYILEELAEFMGAKTVEDQADALTDMMYFILGTFTLMGIKPENIFEVVAQANLGKIQPDGTVLRDSQGKITKPEGWKETYAPEGKIRAEIKRQERVAYHERCGISEQQLGELDRLVDQDRIKRQGG